MNNNLDENNQQSQILNNLNSINIIPPSNSNNNFPPINEQQNVLNSNINQNMQPTSTTITGNINQSPVMEQPQIENTEIQENNNKFINPNINQEPQNMEYTEILKQEGINFGNQSNNKFLNNQFNETSINDLNVNSDYNNMGANYINDPQVKSNIEEIKTNKKTITITQELKIIIIISIVLFIFILIMPSIFDLIRNIG